MRACLPCCLGNLVPDSCSAACGVQTLFRVLPARPPDVCSRPAAAPMATPHITPLSGPAGEVSVSDHYKVVLALTALGPCVPRPLSARGRSLCAQAPALDSCARVPRSRSTDAALLGSAVAASARASHSRLLVRAVVADALCGERVRGSPIRLDSLRCVQSSLSSSVFAARVSSGGDDTDRVASAQRQAPPGKPPSFPAHCAACGAGLVWLPAQILINCPGCHLAVSGVPRVVASAAASRALTAGSVPAVDVTLLARSGPFVPSVADYLWAGLLMSPVYDGVVDVCRAGDVLACMGVRQARWIRACLLLQWADAAPTTEFNEIDVAAAVIRLVSSLPPAQWPRPPDGPFLGQWHVFADSGCAHEAGRWRAAKLPCAFEPSWLDPATSAYTNITGFTGSLSADAYEALLAGHPLLPLNLNSIRYGSPLIATLPETGRPLPASVPPSDPHALRGCVDVEVQAGAFLPLPPDSIPDFLRMAPLFTVPKSEPGKFRLVADLTAGEDSVNAATRRGSLPRARLLGVGLLFDRILAMQRARPGVRIKLWRIDMRRAFRQMGMAIAAFAAVAHMFGDNVFVSTRQTMGGTAAADSQSEMLSPIQEIMAAVLAAFTGVFLDDVVGVSYEDVALMEEAAALALLRQLGWIIADDKLVLPSSATTVLGVHIDTVVGIAGLTATRLADTLALLRLWLEGKVRPSVKNCQSLAGKLAFLAAVVPFGKIFLRSLFDSCALADLKPTRPARLALRVGRNRSRLRAPPTLSPALVSDLTWWFEQLSSTRAVVSFRPIHIVLALEAFCDAAKSGFGCAVPAERLVMYGSWTPQERLGSSVNAWEYATIVMAFSVLAAKCTGRTLLIRTDSSSSFWSNFFQKPRSHAMHALLKILSCLQVHFKVLIRVEWLPGVLNPLADLLSRLDGRQLTGEMATWRRLHPHPRLRALVESVLTASLSVASQALDHRFTLPFSCSDVTAITATIASRSHMPMTVKNFRPTAPPALGGSTTSPAGSPSSTAITTAPPSAAFCQRCARISRLFATGPSFVLQSFLCTCIGCGNSLARPLFQAARARLDPSCLPLTASDSLPLFLWSSASWSIPQLISASGRLCWLSTRHFVVAASCARVRLSKPRLSAVCSAVMSLGLLTCVLSGLLCLTVRLTPTTPALLCTSPTCPATRSAPLSSSTDTVNLSPSRAPRCPVSSLSALAPVFRPVSRCLTYPARSSTMPPPADSIPPASAATPCELVAHSSSSLADSLTRPSLCVGAGLCGSSRRW